MMRRRFSAGAGPGLQIRWKGLTASSVCSTHTRLRHFIAALPKRCVVHFMRFSSIHARRAIHDDCIDSRGTAAIHVRRAIHDAKRQFMRRSRNSSPNNL